MNWTPLTDSAQLNAIYTLSYTKPVIIFKHSTRCSVSSMILNRLERAETPTSADFYFLDLISYRAISNALAEKFSVHHESPQILLIKNGECVYEESHNAISMDEIAQNL
ncbi:MAG: bacillithiol system redox-active protein YtxJ [Chitinophagaceae bacterium]|nr:bacillithiol system redox-active protein YtxJ [Chitinophagaceae bacterium]